MTNILICLLIAYCGFCYGIVWQMSISGTFKRKKAYLAAAPLVAIWLMLDKALNTLGRNISAWGGKDEQA